jgi:hypothetical protein
VNSKRLVDSCRKVKAIIKINVILVAVSLVCLAIITGCGSDVASVELPKDFIQDFIAKHETMADKSLVYYYVKSDQPEIAEQIEVACRINKSKGVLEILENATFDFSELQIKIVDKKEEYIDDEPVVFIKVAVKGCFKMQLPEAIKTIDTDDIIVLQMAKSEWKVTNTNNPWS